jgi:hypothetical protein
MSMSCLDRSAAFMAPTSSRSSRDARVVQEWTIDLAEERRGTVKAYRPVRPAAYTPRWALADSGRSIPRPGS